jgi:hypothetical protein
MTYDVGGNEDAQIVVTRPDMGVQAGGDALTISLHQFRQYLQQEFGVTFEVDNQGGSQFHF